MINSYARLTNVAVGLDSDNVMSMELNLFGMDRYRTLRTTSHWIAKPEISNFYTSALERIVSLPIFPAMTDRDVEDVIAAVWKVVTAYGVA